MTVETSIVRGDERIPYVDLCVIDQASACPGSLAARDGAGCSSSTRRPRLPVLVTTNYMDELPRQGREHGQRLNILAKPYKHGDLLQRVEAALGREA